MADQTIKVGIQVSSDGTLPKTEKEASGVHQQLAKAAESSDKLNASLRASKALQAAASKAPADKMTGQEYNKAHSLTGASGASARDFADQSRGLGGLVRLYATYAANIFAVGAAFSALKSAMDTTNMVRGMDQLGAISGVALGTMAKNLVTATDGALSLKEAMAATTKVISSGIDSSAVEKIGKVAKGASQALGLDMQDAVNRLTRGITKLEPELLDELGIFVRIDDVVAKYAMSVGKSASALTDFERRQAFANAVLDQGQKKFGDIKIETNPYDKLLASVKDLGQKVLELVNVALVPLLNSLASSPTALLTVMGSLAVLLVKQAIPAVGQFRQGLQEAEEVANKFAKAKAADAIAARAKQMNAIEAMIEKEADLQIEKTDAAAKKVEEIQSRSKQKAGTAAMQLLDTPAQLRTEQMYAAAKAEADAIDQQIKSIDKRTKAGKAQAAVLREEQAAINESIAVARASQSAEEALEQKKQKHRQELEKDPSRWSALGNAQKMEAQAEASANRTRIVSNAGLTGSLLGVRAAMSELKAEFAAKNQSMWSAPWTVMSAGISAVTGRIGALLNSLGPWIMAFQMAVAVGTALNAMFSSNSEQSAKFNESLDSLSKAVKTAGDNAEYFIKQDWNGALPLAIVTSRATALKELSVAVNKVAEDFDKVASKRSGWDSFWNSVFAVIPFAKSDQQKASKTLAEGISESIKLIPYGPLRKEYESKIAAILKTDRKLTSQEIELRLKTMGEKEAIKAAQDLGKAQEYLANTQKAAAQSAADVDQAFKDTALAYQELATSLFNPSPLEKFGASLLAISAKLTDSLKNPTEAFASLTKLLTEPKQMALLGPESFAALQSAKEEINSISQQIKEAEKEAADLYEKNKNIQASKRISKEKKAEWQAEVDAADRKLEELKAVGAQIAAKIYNAVNIENFRTAGKILAAEMTAAGQQAALTVRKAYSSLFTGQAAINEQTAVAKEDLLIKRNLVSVTAELVKSNFLLINSNNQLLNQEALREADRKLAENSGASPAERDAAQKFKDTGFDVAKKQLEVERSVISSRNPRAAANLAYGSASASPNAQQLQSLQPLLNALEGAQKQIMAIDASIKSEDIKKLIATYKETSRLALIQKNYEVQANELALRRRDTLEQLGIKIDANTVQERIALENQLELNKQAAKELETRSNIAAIEQLKSSKEFAAMPQDFKKNVEDQLAQEKKTLADMEAAAQREKNLKAEADQLRVIQATYNQTIEQLDKQLQKDRELLSIKEAEASRTKAANDQELSSLVALEAVSNRTRINRQYSIDIAAIEAERSNKVRELELDKARQLDEIIAKRKVIESFNIREVQAENAKKAKIEERYGREQEFYDVEIALAKARGESSQYIADLESKAQLSTIIYLKELGGINANLKQLDADRLKGLGYLKTEEDRINESFTRRIGIINDNAKAQGNLTTGAAALSRILDEQNIKLADRNRYLELSKNLGESLRESFSLFGDSMAKAGENLAKLVEGFAAARVESLKYADDREKAEQRLAAAQKDNDPKAEMQARKEIDRLDADNTRNQLKRDTLVIGSAKKLFGEKTLAYRLLAGMEKAMHLARLAMDVKEMFFDTTKTGTSVANSLARAGAAGLEAVVKAYTLPPPLGFVTGAAMTVIIAGLLGSLFKGKRSGSAAFAMNSEQMQETQGTGTTYDVNGTKIETGAGVFGNATEKIDSINKSLKIIADNSVEGLSYDNKMLNAFKSLSNALTGAATAIYAIPGLRQGGTSFGTLAGATSDAGSWGSVPIVGKLLGSIFGGGTSSTTTIESAGIQLRGTFQQLIDDTSNSVRQYKDVLMQFHEDGGWFGSDSDWSERRRETADIGTAAQTAIKNIFLESKSMFTAIGKVAGVTAADVNYAFANMSANLDVDLKGLTGDQIVKELNAVIGSKLDEAAKVLFSSFDKYKKFGEEYLTTVVRVTDTNTKIQQVLTNIGINTVVDNLYDITEGMAELAGGIDKFVEQYDFFKTNFLTSKEQLVPVQRAVNDELTRLGLSLSMNREQFTAVVRSLDVTTESGRSTYQALMNLAPGMDAILKAQEKIAAERAGLEKRLLTLQGDTNALRELELEALDESNWALQRQIWAYEDQQAAAKALKSGLDGVTKTMKSQITTLSDYKTSLLTSDKTTLTKTQQYQASRDEINALLSTINSAATTPEQVEARNTAISKLNTATDKFLGLSRSLFASGSQYTADFNSVMNTVDTVIGTLEARKTEAEQQIDQLVTANSYLSTISDSSKTTNQLLAEYLAKGGTGVTTNSFAVGTNYVPQDMVATIHRGERIIPMADNFKLMTRLTDTDNATREMCVELRNLNQKIDSLERVVAEGAVINAAATDRNTEQIAQVITDTSGKTIQAARLQNKVSIK